MFRTIASKKNRRILSKVEQRLTSQITITIEYREISQRADHRLFILKKLLRNRFPPPGCSRIRWSRCEWRRRRCYRENPWRTLYRINYPPEEARSPVQLFSSNDCRDTRWDEKSYTIVALQRVFDQPTTTSTLQAFQLTYTHAHTIDSAKKGEHFDRKNSLCSRKFAFPFFFFNLILSIQLIEWSFVTILPPSSGRLIPFFFFFFFSPLSRCWSVEQ